MFIRGRAYAYLEQWPPLVWSEVSIDVGLQIEEMYFHSLCPPHFDPVDHYLHLKPMFYHEAGVSETNKYNNYPSRVMITEDN